MKFRKPWITAEEQRQEKLKNQQEVFAVMRTQAWEIDCLHKGKFMVSLRGDGTVFIINLSGFEPLLSQVHKNNPDFGRMYDLWRQYIANGWTSIRAPYGLENEERNLYGNT